MSTTTPARLPYWLEEGSELCEACQHGFARETGFHCRGCDAHLCGQCVVLDPATGAMLCLTCRDTGCEGE